MRAVNSSRIPKPCPVCHLLLIVMALTVCGCSTIKTTGTPRSGTEQLLLTNTWDEVLCKVDYQPLEGSNVFLDTSRIDVVDKGWVIATLQRSLLRHGVVLKEAKKDAQLVLVAALAAYGTDEKSFHLGLEGGRDLTVGGFSFSTPESSPSLFKINNQSSVVKLALFAYDQKTSTLVWESGPISSYNSIEDRFVLGVGPERKTTVPDIDRYTATTTPRCPVPPGGAVHQDSCQVDPAVFTEQPPLCPSSTRPLHQPSRASGKVRMSDSPVTLLRPIPTDENRLPSRIAHPPTE